MPFPSNDRVHPTRTDQATPGQVGLRHGAYPRPWPLSFPSGLNRRRHVSGSLAGRSVHLNPPLTSAFRALVTSCIKRYVAILFRVAALGTTYGAGFS